MTNYSEEVEIFREFIEKAKMDEKPHQIEGLRWIMENEKSENKPHNVHGGLIADEMGLGKTIQMIGAIVCNPQRQTLIVVPLALLDQWFTVIAKTTGHKALLWHGAEKKTITAEKMKAAPIVITTYGHIGPIKAKSKANPPLLSTIRWSRIIFDEAHHMRNKNTRVHKGALNLKADIRWLVTGTPIQNRKDDFYSLCAVMGLPSKYYTESRKLMDLVRNFILKRTKKEAGVELPPMIATSNIIPWKSEVEQTLAEDIHSMLRFSMVNKRQINNVVEYMSSYSPGQLALLTRARQVCVYPRLMKNHLEKMVKDGLIQDHMDPVPTDDQNQDQDQNQNPTPQQQQVTSIMEACDQSSKIDAIIDLILSRKNNECGKLVFCHYRGEIDTIAERLRKEEMVVETFDGRTGNAERNKILTNRDLDVLILQIQTGCEGLNLQHFSEIYFASPHWNPAIEDQAVARCHRIGQEKEVNVFRFEMGGFNEEGSEETRTLDTYAANVQESKRHVATILDECKTNQD